MKKFALSIFLLICICGNSAWADLVKPFGTPQLSYVFHVHQLALKVIGTHVAQI